MSTPNRQPSSFPGQRMPGNTQNTGQQQIGSPQAVQQPGYGQQQQGYWADAGGNPVFRPQQQGTVRMGPHGPVGYPEVPEDAWNDSRAELQVDRQPLRWVPGPLPAGWSMPQQGQAPNQTPPRPQPRPQTQASPTGRPPQGNSPRGTAQGATTQTSSPVRSFAADGRRGSGTGTLVFNGFPDRDAQIPANLSCYEVCQKYPNSLVDDNLDAFLQRNWSAGEVNACLPATVRNAMPQSNPTWLTNRLIKRQDRLIKNGVFDRDIYRPASQGNFLRADGRPATMTQYKSKQAVSDAKTTRPHGVD